MACELLTGTAEGTTQLRSAVPVIANRVIPKIRVPF